MNETLHKLLMGNKAFQKKFFQDDTALFDALVTQGQRPKVMIIACSDSRVDPAMIFNCMPGELFVVRNVANLVPPCEDAGTYHGTSAALQFGVCFLEVEHLIILGHSQCGGIRALVEGFDDHVCEKPSSFITKWMEIAAPAFDVIKREHPHASTQETIDLVERTALIHSLDNVHTFPWIAQKVEQGQLKVHAWYFDLCSGSFERYDSNHKQWIINDRD